MALRVRVRDWKLIAGKLNLEKRCDWKKCAQEWIKIVEEAFRV